MNIARAACGKDLRGHPLRTLVCLIPLCAALLAACTTDGTTGKRIFIEDDADTAKGLHHSWADPTGDTSPAKYVAAEAACKKQIQEGSTDQIRQFATAQIRDCLEAKGWKWVVVK